MTLCIAMVSISFCKKDVKTIPDHLRKGTPEYHTSQGYKSMNEGSLKTAEEEFKKAVKKNPGLIRAVMGLGIVYLTQMKFRESLKEFREIVKHNPSNADAYNFIGIIHTELGNYEEARRKYGDNFTPKHSLGKNDRPEK